MNVKGIQKIIGTIVFWTIQLSLFFAKLFGAIDWSWWLVFLPSIIVGGLVLLGILIVIIVAIFVTPGARARMLDSRSRK